MPAMHAHPLLSFRSPVKYFIFGTPVMVKNMGESQGALIQLNKTRLIIALEHWTLDHSDCSPAGPFPALLQLTQITSQQSLGMVL